jgi:hypothetical protein
MKRLYKEAKTFNLAFSISNALSIPFKDWRARKSVIGSQQGALGSRRGAQK